MATCTTVTVILYYLCKLLQPSSTTNYYSLHLQKPYFGLTLWFKIAANEMVTCEVVWP